MNSPIGKRVTLVDIGRACGYHGTTVGLALRDHPSIPEKTRLKIKQKAQEMGYHPDPALRALVVHRYGLAKGGFDTIAVISDHKSPHDWHLISKVSGSEYYKGMVSRANQIGYKLEEFTVGEDRKGEKQVDRILKARGISAVIVAPLIRFDVPINLDWNHYSAIAIGYSLCAPALPRVTHQHRTGCQLAVESLIRLGYKRIAFLNPDFVELRVGFGYSAGFFGTVNYHRDLVKSFSLLPKGMGNLGTMDTIKWIKGKKPDAVITSQNHLLWYLKDHGIRIPEDLGFAKLGVEFGPNQVSGIYENSPTVGEEAVNLISQMQAANIRGCPSIPQIHLVQGLWVPGTTVRSVGPSLL